MGFVKRWLTVREVADHFSISRQYVYTLIDRGQLEAIVIGCSRGRRITSASVERLERCRKIDPEDSYR